MTADVGTTQETSAIETLRARARELAKPPAREDSSMQLVEIVDFRLGPERYAFPAALVREVFNLTEITLLPGVPPFVLGVTNLRGRILSVIDIRRLFGFGGIGLTNLNRAIVLCHEGMELAVLADEVVGTYTSDRAKWQKSMPTLAGNREKFLGGVTGDRVVVLDAEALLKSKDLLVGAE